MSPLAATLWDLLGGSRRPPRRRTRAPAPDSPAARARARRQARYDALVRDMKRRHGIRVRKWRTSSSGVAWQVTYEDGRVARLVEAPYPRGPMSCAIFLHEVGHHVIGFGTHRVRCLEEYHAWRWSLETMRAHGFSVTPAVERRMAESLRYAVEKGVRRGLRRVPVELEPFAHGQLTAISHTHPASLKPSRRPPCQGSS